MLRGVLKKGHKMITENKEIVPMWNVLKTQQEQAVSLWLNLSEAYTTFYKETDGSHKDPKLDKAYKGLADAIDFLFKFAKL